MDPNSRGPRQEEVNLFDRFKVMKSDIEMIKMLGSKVKQQVTDDPSKKQKNPFASAFETVEIQKARQLKKKDSSPQTTLGGELQPANGVKFKEF